MTTTVFTPELLLDRGSTEPLARQIVCGIETELKRQRPRAGARMLPERQLAERLDVTRPTVHRAYDELMKKGLLQGSERSRGVFVADDLRRKLAPRFPVIGVIIPRGFSEFMQEETLTRLDVIGGIVDRASELAHSVIMLQLPACHADDETVAQWLGHHAVRTEGIIHLGARSEVTDRPLQTLLRQRHLPQVFFAGHSPSPAVSEIYCHVDPAIRNLADYLLEQGHRRALLIGHYRPQEAMFRELEYEDITRTHRAFALFNEAGLRVAPEDHILSWGDADRLKGMLARALGGPGRPSVIFTRRDITAILAMRLVKELGLRVPEDVSVVGCDGLADGERTEPPLTTLRIPLHQMARRCVDELLKHEPKRSVPFEASLLVRNSVRLRTLP